MNMKLILESTYLTFNKTESAKQFVFMDAAFIHSGINTNWQYLSLQKCNLKYYQLEPVEHQQVVTMQLPGKFSVTICWDWGKAKYT